jgi:hypothetical protein
VSKLRSILVCLLVAALAAPPIAAARTEAIDVSATVSLVPGKGAVLQQNGRFAGAPFGRGTIRLRTRLGQGDGAVFSFVMATSRGTLRGSGTISLDFSGRTVTYSGTANITGGTGAYRRATGRGLRVGGRGGVDANAYSFRMIGRLSS